MTHMANGVNQRNKVITELQRPLLIYDGECALCRYSVACMRPVNGDVDGYQLIILVPIAQIAALCLPRAVKPSQHPFQAST